MTVRIKHKGQALAALSITPLIDVLFMLLVFLLVVTNFKDKDRELDVVLPSASEARPMTEEPRELWVNVDAEGKFFVDGQTLDADEVAGLLRQAAVDNPGSQSVIIRADRRVEFDHVVTVMNLCNQVGILNYTVTTAGEGS